MVSRAEHRRTTLLSLGEAAVALFETEGPDVTIGQIAQAAGVSRRTVFRYVEAKEELAFVHPLLWFDVFDAGLDAAPPAPLSERLRVGSRAIALHIDADPEPPRRAFLVAAMRPDIRRGYFAVSQRWVDRIADEVLTSFDDPTTDQTFHARIIGGAVMGMVDAVTREWVVSAPTTRFTDLYDVGFSMLAPLFAELPNPSG